jgi:hypothetical protein
MLIHNFFIISQLSVRVIFVSCQSKIQANVSSQLTPFRSSAKEMNDDLKFASIAQPNCCLFEQKFVSVERIHNYTLKSNL